MRWKDLLKTGRAKPPVPPPAAAPSEYRLLQKYLENRYADTVVLTFGEIEDLIGAALPGPARFQQEWWANADGDSGPSAQAQSWTHASRTAKPNLRAGTVTFERSTG
jgi:hypothetical protein